MAKIRIREIESHLTAIQKIIDDCRTDIAAEKAAAGQDQPPTEPAMGGAGVGEDSDPWSHGRHAVRSKGLTAIAGPSSGLLEGIPGYGRINQHHSDTTKNKRGVE